MKESAELMFLRMENQLLKDRLLTVTKNPEYIRPPNPYWIGYEPKIIDVKRREIYYHTVCEAGVDRQDAGHHLILRWFNEGNKDKVGGFLYYSYLVSDRVVLDHTQKFSALEQIYSKCLQAIAHAVIVNSYNFNEKENK